MEKTLKTSEGIPRTICKEIEGFTGIIAEEFPDGNPKWTIKEPMENLLEKLHYNFCFAKLISEWSTEEMIFAINPWINLLRYSGRIFV